MSRKTRRRRYKPAWWYRQVARLHSAVPRHLFSGGYALPAWHYFLEVTRRCNQRCAMCQYRASRNRPAGSHYLEDELATEEWRRVIEQTGRFSLLTFTGGEPLIRDDMAELLEYACALRRVHLITNGALLTEGLAARIVAWAPDTILGKGFWSVGVSLEGPGPAHDRITGSPGAFERAVAGIRALADRRAAAGKRLPQIHVTTVVQRDNLDALPSLANIASLAGADALNLVTEIRTFDPAGVGRADPDAFAVGDVSLPRLDPNELGQALEGVERAAQEVGLPIRLPRMPRRELLNYYDGGLDLRRYVCRSAWTTMYVAADGGVASCLIHRAGNVRNERLKVIWNNAAMRSWRKRRRNALTALCQGCCELEYRRGMEPRAANEEHA